MSPTCRCGQHVFRIVLFNLPSSFQKQKKKNNFVLFELQLWYHVSKTLAEKAAWNFAEEEGLQLVVLNPGTVLGPTLTPSVGFSLQLLLRLLEGQSSASQICSLIIFP